MKNSLSLVAAAFCVAFMFTFTTAARAVEPPSDHAKAVGDLAECKAQLGETSASLEETQAKLDQCLAGGNKAEGGQAPSSGRKSQNSPPKPKQYMCLVNDRNGNTAEFGPFRNKDECTCPAGSVMESLPHSKNPGGRSDLIYMICVNTDSSLSPRMAEAEERLRALKARVDMICGGGDLEACRETRATFEELRDWFLELAHPPEGSETPALSWDSWDELWRRSMNNARTLMDHERRITEIEERTGGSSNEWALGACGLGVFRPAGPPDTYGGCGQVGYTGWFDAEKRNAFQLTGVVGGGYNANGNHAIAGAELDFVHGFGDGRQHRLQVGLTGLVEPARSGNESSFFGPRVSYRWAPPGFFVEPSIAAGPNTVPMRDDAGELTGDLGTGVAIVGKVGVGFHFGGPSATSSTSSSATTGGSVSAETH